MKKSILMLLGLLAFPAIALAHPGHDVANFASGFAHPLSGIDHLLVMLAVGFWAGQSQTRARWQLPVFFILLMLAGVAMGTVISAMHFVEVAIAVSVLAMGLIILLSTSINRLWQVILTAAFTGLHGLVHGQELTFAGNGLASISGMLLATVLLISAGVYLASFNQRYGLIVKRSLAALLTLSGAYLVIM